jgi:hypothetical protein
MAAQQLRQAVRLASEHQRRIGAPCVRTGTRSLHEDARGVMPARRPWMPGVPFLARRMWMVAVSRSICCRRMSTSSLTRNASRKAQRTSTRSRVGLRLLPAVSISVAISPLSDTRAAGNRRSWPSGQRGSSRACLHRRQRQPHLATSTAFAR